MRKTIKIGKIAMQGNGRRNLLTVELELKQTTDKKRSWDTLEELPPGQWIFSAYCSVWNQNRSDIIMGGQCFDSISNTDLLALTPDQRTFFRQVRRLWKNYHLNDMKSGTTRQTSALTGMGEPYDYQKARDFLSDKGLLLDRGYDYGHSWFLQTIPEDAVKQIQTILDMDWKL